jgi:hypothetical protein
MHRSRNDTLYDLNDISSILKYKIVKVVVFVGMNL